MNLDEWVAEFAADDADAVTDEQALADYDALCREVDTDPQEQQRVRDIADLIDADAALYTDGLAALENDDLHTARALLRRAADRDIGDAADLLEEIGEGCPDTAPADPPDMTASVLAAVTAAGALAKTRDLVIGVVGSSGTGKSTFARALIDSYRRELAIPHHAHSSPASRLLLVVDSTTDAAMMHGLLDPAAEELPRPGNPCLCHQWFLPSGMDGGHRARSLAALPGVLSAQETVLYAAEAKDCRSGFLLQCRHRSMRPRRVVAELENFGQIRLIFTMNYDHLIETVPPARVSRTDLTSWPLLAGNGLACLSTGVATAGDVMTPAAEMPTVSRTMTVDGALKIVLRDDGSGTPVLDGDDLVGVITPGDIGKAIHAARGGLASGPVEAHMRDPVYVAAETPIDVVREVVTQGGAGLAAVLTAAGQVAGYVTTTDLYPDNPDRPPCEPPGIPLLIKR